jgi:hypothetical protein
MMPSPSEAHTLRQKIDASAGARFMNRAHAHTFSLNIFQMNAHELMEASRRMRDPDQGLSLMLEKNREAGRQAHRELNRHVHNFAASALTLVEHTRIMMREHYADTEFHKAYEDEVAMVFVNEPVANFVQGLRNYMVHKGLPNSHMFLSFKSDPNATDGSGTQETGVRYDTASLLEWPRWKPPARKYLNDSGEHLDVHRFAEAYLVLVNRFYAWLDSTLQDHHKADLEELGELNQRLLQILPANFELVPETQLTASQQQPFEFESNQSGQLNQAAIDLLAKVRELVFAPNALQGFPTQRPIVANLTDADMIGTPIFWGPDIHGARVVSFIENYGRLFGLSEQDHGGLSQIADLVLAAPWARDRLSQAFIEENFIAWARERFGVQGRSFAEALAAAAKVKVRPVEVWAPVAHFEVEEGFEFGPVRVAPVTAEMIDALESKRPDAMSAESKQSVQEFFQKLRREIQGIAAIIVPVEAEPLLATDRGRRIAQDALSLLRFLSPTAGMSWTFCPVALIGTDYLPTTKILVATGTGFTMTEGLLAGSGGYWRMSSQELAVLKSDGLKEAASLILPEGLSEFALAVRANVIIFSKGMTMTDPIDRLEHALSALEGLLLKHEMEPVAANVAARTSFLLAKTHADRELVAQAVRQAYWLHTHPRLAPLSPHEDQALMLFISHANGVIRTALRNLYPFASKAAFVAAVDQMALVEA